MMDGTQMPTKTPASLLATRPIPNHKETEKRKDKKAANMINRSPLPNIDYSSIGSHTILMISQPEGINLFCSGA